MTKIGGKSAKAIAFEFFSQGKRPADLELKALGVKERSLFNYFQEFKKLNPSLGSSGDNGDGESKDTEGDTSKDNKVSGGKPVEVGKITIAPENWRMTQYGAMLILDTYERTKKGLGYTGTVGDFLCDICEFYRRLLNYQGEVKNGGEGSEGTGSAEEDGQPSTDRVLEPAVV